MKRAIDPDANLEEIRHIIDRIDADEFAGEDLEQLVDLVRCLDDWLADGGRRPKDWREAP